MILNEHEYNKRNEKTQISEIESKESLAVEEVPLETEEVEPLDKMKQCGRYVVDSLEGFLEIVTHISELPMNKNMNLWYRGHQYKFYNLLPSLFRAKEPIDHHNKGYGFDHLREDYRYQQFRSKCDQMLLRYPSMRIEWQEIMQHHFGKTRLMDWTESAITALLFALEAFITPGTGIELAHLRSTITPTVWLLNPKRLNKYVIDKFSASKALLEMALSDLCPPHYSAKTKNEVTDAVWAYIDNNNYKSLLDQLDCSSSGVCLAALEAERQASGSRYLSLLASNERNPYFYLFLRYYVDGLPVELGMLPPLAIVHPYHSERIEAQRGVFTVMPHYMGGNDPFVYGSGFDLRAMDAQPDLSDYISEIQIMNPRKVAQELLSIGERHSHLYPELERYLKEIEVPYFAC